MLDNADALLRETLAKARKDYERMNARLKELEDQAAEYRDILTKLANLICAISDQFGETVEDEIKERCTYYKRPGRIRRQKAL